MNDTNRRSSRRPSREEIIDLFRACASKNGGETPGKALFQRECKITEAQVRYAFWKGGYAELAEAAGLTLNSLNARLNDDVVFSDYARICLHIQRVPNHMQQRGAQRELGTRTHSVEERFPGGLVEFQRHFRAWLLTQPSEIKTITEFSGWQVAKSANQNGEAQTEFGLTPSFYPFLPASLQYLDVLARGDDPPFEFSQQPISTIFERRTADAFRCLGFEVSQLGQGTGRNADALALAPKERYAVIIDAKVRSAGYVLGTEDRKFLEYARNHGAELQRQGFEKIYFTVIGSFFRESDLSKLTDALSASPIRSVNLITASALMRLVEESIRDRSKFSLTDFERSLFANKIVPG